MMFLPLIILIVGAFVCVGKYEYDYIQYCKLMGIKYKFIRWNV